ncbi:MAG TPA: hypothetical protein VF066_15905 [Thermoleophilaceae bacterium]
MPRRRKGWTPAQRRTAVIGGAAAATAIGAFAVELGRVWRRGSAPLPAEAESVAAAAVEAAVETTDVAVAGYQAAPPQENALFNLFASFVISLVGSRAIAFALRDRHTVGPFRNLRVGRRHIHHFVPGIALAFVSGAVALVTRDEQLEPKLALLFGTGMGMTMDEAALLLELDDVYWTEEGLLGVQIGAGLVGLLGALAIGLRFLRRGEAEVLPDGGPRYGSPGEVPAAAG